MSLSKKIGIITLFGYFNFGNRLQNYALEEAIRKTGFEVETVVIQSKAEIRKQKIKKIFLGLGRKILESEKKVLQYRPEFIKKILGKISRRVEKKEKDKYLENFSKELLNEKFYKYSKKELKKINDEYKYFVVGSDQVWNPHYLNKIGSIYFLEFANKEKRISYSPSFGVAAIPKEYRSEYKSNLLNMGTLSVRELAGQKIIKELTGRDSEILVDPTLLITKNEWLEIACPANNKPTEKFLVTYFLGDVDSKTKEKIRLVAQKNGLKIVRLADKKDKNHFKNGPREFIDYINSAQVVLTDSFHGTVFSILMETPFIVYKKNGSDSMYSRIETLLDMFSLKSREVKNIKSDEQVFKADFSHVHEILELERKKAYSYLKKAFQVEK